MAPVMTWRQVSGADVLLALHSAEGRIPAARLADCTFTNNSATNGGGLLYAMACPRDNLATCQPLTMSGAGTRLAANKAAGGSGPNVWALEVRLPCCCIPHMPRLADVSGHEQLHQSASECLLQHLLHMAAHARIGRAVSLRVP